MSPSLESLPHLRLDYGSIRPFESSDSENANTGRRRVLRCYEPLGLILFGMTILIVSVAVVVLFQSANTLITSPTSTLSIVNTVSDSGRSTESMTPLDELQDPSTVVHPSSYISASKFPQISLDFDRERQVNNGYSVIEQTSITVSWTMGRVNDHDLLDPQRDIIALLCGDSLSHFVEAKRLAQTSSRRRRLGSWHYGSSKNSDWWGGSGVVHERTWRSSSSFDGWHIIHDSSYESDNDDDNQWIIDPVPESILDQKKCQFVIYYKIRDYEYVAVSKSAIIQF
jgi:hypothetical protein